MTKQAATKAGKALLARMNGKGWKLRVWENFGWHYAVNLGPINVFPEGGISDPVGARFHILMNDRGNDSTGGSYQWLVRRHFKDPNAAVRAQLRLARKRADEINRLVTKVEDAMR
jgi:hypothetical protein